MNITSTCCAKPTRLLLFLALALIVTSCQKEIDWVFPEQSPVPTIIGLAEAGKPISIHVSLSGNIDSTKLKNIHNAQVRLLENGQYAETLEHESDGLYTSSLLAKQGTEYQCEVSIEGHKLVTATTYVPVAVPIIAVKNIKKAWFDYWGDIQNAVEVTFDSKETQYLEIIVWTMKGRRIRHGEIDDPVLLNEGLGLTLFNTVSIPTDTYTMNLNLQTQDDTLIIVELRTVSSHYYNYSKQYELYSLSRFRDDTDGVVTAFPLYSNIKGGYGIFAGYSNAISGPTPHQKENETAKAQGKTKATTKL